MSGGEGKRFEQNIKDSCMKQDILWERYPDSNKFGDHSQARFTMKSPCDGHIFKDGNLYYIELKSSKTGSVSFELEKTAGSSKSIKAHQIKSLLERSKYDGVTAGFIIWFLPKKTKTLDIEGGAYFINIKRFIAWAAECGKKSINKRDAEDIGIPIKYKMLKVNNQYDIIGLLDDVKAVGLSNNSGSESGRSSLN